MKYVIVISVLVFSILSHAQQDNLDDLQLAVAFDSVMSNAEYMNYKLNIATTSSEECKEINRLDLAISVLTHNKIKHLAKAYDCQIMKAIEKYQPELDKLNQLCSDYSLDTSEKAQAQTISKKIHHKLISGIPCSVHGRERE